MKKTPKHGIDPEFQAYAEMMANHIRATQPLRKRLEVPEGMTPEEFAFSIQTPAFKAAAARTEEQQAAWRDRIHGPPPEGWKAVDINPFNDDGSINEEAMLKLVGARKLTPEEISHVENIRRRPKNSFGQSEKSSVSAERKELGRQAFLFTPPAKVTDTEIKERAVSLVSYKSREVEHKWVEIPWYKALIHRLRGKEVKRDEEGRLYSWNEFLEDSSRKG